MIQSMEGTNLLNRRGEWGQNLPPKIQIEDEDKSEKKVSKRKSKVALEVTQEGTIISRDELEPTNSKKIRLEETIRSVKSKVQLKPSLAPPKSGSMNVKQMLTAMSRPRLSPESQASGLINSSQIKQPEVGDTPQNPEEIAFIGAQLNESSRQGVNLRTRGHGGSREAEEFGVKAQVQQLPIDKDNNQS